MIDGVEDRYLYDAFVSYSDNEEDADFVLMLLEVCLFEIDMSISKKLRF